MKIGLTLLAAVCLLTIAADQSYGQCRRSTPGGSIPIGGYNRPSPGFSLNGYPSLRYQQGPSIYQQQGWQAQAQTAELRRQAAQYQYESARAKYRDQQQKKARSKETAAAKRAKIVADREQKKREVIASREGAKYAAN
ncbi:MAG: hypothetical protein ACI9G1_001233 [Pirellulaceae bacterium]|jgi:hypothetical protein